MSSREKLRAAVIGVGSLGRFHAQKYASLGHIEFRGVADLDPRRARAIAEQYAVRAVTDYRELLAEIDIASIVVPTEAHFEVASACLNAGVHVLVEKPIARSLEEADALIALAARKNLTLAVGHLERFNPAFTDLSAMLDRPFFIEAERLGGFKGRGTDVDVVLDLMIHDIDLALALAKAPVISVSAAGTPVVSGENDVVGARLTFDNGIVANLSASRVAGETERSVTVNEAGRKLRADLSAHTLTITPEGGPAETQTFGPADNLAAEIASFLDCVATGAKPLVDGRAGLEALKVAEMIRTAVTAEQTRTGVMDG